MGRPCATPETLLSCAAWRTRQNGATGLGTSVRRYSGAPQALCKVHVRHVECITNYHGALCVIDHSNVRPNIRGAFPDAFAIFRISRRI